MGCCFLLQGIFLTQGSNLSLLLGRHILYHWANREVTMDIIIVSVNEKLSLSPWSTVPGTKVLLKCWLDSVSHRYKTSCWVLCSLKLFLEVIFLANFFSGEKQNKAGFPSWLSGRVPPTKQKHRFDAWSGSGKIPHVMKQLNPWVPTTEPEL